MKRFGKLINFRYIFYPFLIFLLGMNIARDIFAGNVWTIVVAGLLIFGLIVGCLLRKAYKPLVILLCCFILGNGLYFLGNLTFLSKEYSGMVSIVGRATDDITDYQYASSIVLDDVYIDGEKADNVRVYIKGNGKINAGDILSFEGNVQNSKAFNLRQFNLNDYRDGVRYSTEVRFENLVIADGYLKFDERVRLAVKEELYSNMSQTNAGTAYAVLFGDKNGLDDEVQSAFVASGIVHILAVSGLHVGFLISLFYGVMNKCKVNRYVNFAITTAVIIFYAYLCSFSPSVCRAGIMGIVYMLSKVLHRKYDSLNSLGLAGFIICFVSPLTALDVGFQMSIFCVAVIAVLNKPLTKILSRVMPYKIASLLSLSISAQLGVLPMTVSMGSLNLLSPLTNLIIVPIFSIIYPILFILAFVSTFIPIGSLLVIVDWLFTMISKVAIFFSYSPLTIDIPNFNFSMESYYYLLLFALGGYVMINPYKRLIIAQVMAVLMITSFGITNVVPISSSITYICSHSSQSVILVNAKGEKLIVGYNSRLSTYQSEFDVGDLDTFVSLSRTSPSEIEKLGELGVQNLIGEENVEILSEFSNFQSNKNVYVGDFRIKFISFDETFLGVQISFDQTEIFVASEEEFGYNTLSKACDIQEIDFLFAGNNENLKNEC